MNGNSSIANDLQELGHNLKSKDLNTRSDSLRQIINLFGQGENCSSIQPQVSTFQPDDNVTLHRFSNIINEYYIKDNPSTMQNVVSSIKSDFDNPNYQIKSLAVRQAGSLMTNENAHDLIPIIKAGALSSDPYIRKTSALSILKAYQNSPYIINYYQLGDILKSLVEDSNPNVASNALIALSEIDMTLPTPLFEVTIEMIHNVLENIEEATEWSQAQILEFVSEFQTDKNEAYKIIQKISTRLIQANSAITIAAVRCCLNMCILVNDYKFTKETFNTIMLSLIALLNNNNEIRYSVLKSIFIILQKYSVLFENDVDTFFCKYDDLLYIKLVKIDLILTLTTEKNILKVLKELNSYTTQENIEFVRKSIQAIGRLSIVLEKTADTCVDYLIALIQTRIQYVVQECIVVAVNIFRRYPDKYENLISTICQCVNSTLEDHRAKAAMCWILGEYSTVVTNAAELIEGLFLDSFLDEPTNVQLSILTAVVKFFLNFPEQGIAMLKHVLSLITNEVDNPDIRDRAYMYLCLFAESPKYVQRIVMVKDPPLTNVDLTLIEPNLIDVLTPLVGSLAVLYAKIPQEFVPSIRHKPQPISGIQSNRKKSEDQSTQNSEIQSTQNLLETEPDEQDNNQNQAAIQLTFEVPHEESLHIDLAGVVDREIVLQEPIDDHDENQHEESNEYEEEEEESHLNELPN